MEDDGVRTDRQGHRVHLDKRSLEPDKVADERRDRVNCACIPEAVGWLLVVGVKCPCNGSGPACVRLAHVIGPRSNHTYLT